MTSPLWFSREQASPTASVPFGPCAIRVRSGAREIDPSYIEDQNRLTGGLPTAGMLPSGEDRALVWAYDTNAIPIDPALTAEELKLASTLVHGREIISLDRSRFATAIGAGTR